VEHVVDAIHAASLTLADEELGAIDRAEFSRR
jgi:hypothetical protein